MVYCSVYGCNERHDKNSGVSFHRFPNREKFPKLFSKWVYFCRRKAFLPTKTARICSKHFKSSNYDASQLMLNSKPRLIHGSVPSVWQTEPSTSYRAERLEKRRRRDNNVVENLLSFTLTMTESGNTIDPAEMDPTHSTPPMSMLEPKIQIELDEPDQLPPDHRGQAESEKLSKKAGKISNHDHHRSVEAVLELEENDKSLQCELGCEALRFNPEFNQTFSRKEM